MPVTMSAGMKKDILISFDYSQPQSYIIAILFIISNLLELASKVLGNT